MKLPPAAQRRFAFQCQENNSLFMHWFASNNFHFTTTASQSVLNVDLFVFQNAFNLPPAFKSVYLRRLLRVMPVIHSDTRVKAVIVFQFHTRTLSCYKSDVFLEIYRHAMRTTFLQTKLKINIGKNCFTQDSIFWLVRTFSLNVKKEESF